MSSQHHVMSDMKVKVFGVLLTVAAASSFVILIVSAFIWPGWWAVPIRVMMATIFVVILIENGFLRKGWRVALRSDSLAELAEIAKRNPDVAQWVSAAVRDGRTLRGRDLTVAKDADREYQEAVARMKALDDLKNAVENKQNPA